MDEVTDATSTYTGGFVALAVVDTDVSIDTNVFGLVFFEVAMTVTDATPLLPIYTGGLAGEVMTGLVLISDVLETAAGMLDNATLVEEGTNVCLSLD